MKKTVLAVAIPILFLLGAGVVLASGRPWQDHAAPFDFLFGNHIDTHQQSKGLGQGELQGFFYIRFTGDQTPEGYPLAEHANCSQTPEQCTVGWLLHGIPIQATLLQNEPGAHPLWCVNPGDLPPQAGYSHFHWLGQPEHAHALTPGQSYGGYLLKLTATDTFFFQHQGGFLVTPGLDTATHGNIVTTCGG